MKRKIRKYNIYNAKGTLHWLSLVRYRHARCILVKLIPKVYIIIGFILYAFAISKSPIHDTAGFEKELSFSKIAKEGKITVFVIGASSCFPCLGLKRAIQNDFTTKDLDSNLVEVYDIICDYDSIPPKDIHYNISNNYIRSWIDPKYLAIFPVIIIVSPNQSVYDIIKNDSVQESDSINIENRKLIREVNYIKNIFLSLKSDSIAQSLEKKSKTYSTKNDSIEKMSALSEINIQSIVNNGQVNSSGIKASPLVPQSIGINGGANIIAPLETVKAKSQATHSASSMVPFTTENKRNMIRIPGGTFQMGSNDTEKDWNAYPFHVVTVDTFYMDSTSITQGEYHSLMGINPACFKGNKMRPVEMVSWFDAVLYCNARSKGEGYDTVYEYTGRKDSDGSCIKLDNIAIKYAKKGYRLPTDAEREYACRGGKESSYYWGEECNLAELDKYAYYNMNSGDSSHPVGQKLPNAYHLYDMCGNVDEWCNDWFMHYEDKDQKNPIGPATGEYRVFRGGTYFNGILFLRSANRAYMLPKDRSKFIGFRCVRSYSQR